LNRLLHSFRRIGLTASDQASRARHFFRSPLFPIFMIVFVDVLGTGITIPVLPLYAQDIFHASPMQITLLTATFFIAQSFASPMLGRLSDRVGRRPVLILSQIGTFLALLLSGVAPALAFLYLARAIDGITGGNISVAQAYLSDITEPSRRARGLGIINAAFSSGFIFGPAFGALVASMWGPRMAYYLAAGISVMTILLSVFLLPESLTPARRAAIEQEKAARPVSDRASNMFDLLRIPSVILILFISFCGQIAFFCFQVIYVLWLQKAVLIGYSDTLVQQIVGGILTLTGLAGIITQVWLVGPLVRHFGEQRMVIIGTFMREVAWIMMYFVPLLASSLIVSPLISSGAGVAMPALLALLTYAAPPDRRGQSIGLMETIQNVGRVAGSVIAGVLFEKISPGAPMLAAALFNTAALIASLALLRMHIHKPEDAVAA
jgi:DHA1 family tetracycline resistance protein-like MFS transporter